jgi:putative hydroxymethylpyrimidine transport system substrate-binding protein
MKLRKVRNILLVVMALSLALVSCGKTESKNTDNELEEVNLLLDWYPNAVHSFIFAAEEQGYFKEAGLKVNLIVSASTEDGLKLVASDKVDLAISYPKQVILAKGEGIPVVSVGTIVRSPLNQLMARKDSGIVNLKDLEGKKVGYPSFEIDKATVEAMVTEAGGDPSKVEFIDVSYDLMSAIQTKRVDAIIGGYINHEKILLEKEGIELVTFNPVDYKIPNNYELAFVASDDGVKKNKGNIEAFLNAVKKGFEYTKINPDKALALVLKNQNDTYPLEPEVEKRSLEVLLPLMENSEGTFLSQNKENWSNNYKWLDDKGMIKNKINIEDVFEEIIK